MSGGMQLKVIAALVLALGSACAQAKPVGFLTGNDLMRQLVAHQRDASSSRIDVDTAAAMHVVGYTKAIYDNLQGFELICPAGEVTGGQLVSITKNWMDKHPKEWDTNASMLIGLALSDAFPCK